MSFKLGVVGHRDTLELVRGIVAEYFDDMVVYTEEFGNDSAIEDATLRIDVLQHRCDGLLYSRKDPYLMISSRLKHIIPVRYVDINTSHFLISLLKANIRYHMGPTSISFDTLEYSDVVRAYKSVGISEEHLTLRPVLHSIGQENVVDSFLKQHINHYLNGSTLCVTNITDVYNSLLQADIPAAVITPTTESFVHEIRNLMLRNKIKNMDFGSLAAVHIKLRYKDKYRFYCDMPIREIEELAEANKIMSVFAERMDGCFFQINRWEYYIICDSALLISSCNQFSQIDLLEDICGNTVFDAAIGIGCAKSSRDCHANAVTALNHSINYRSSSAHIALSPQNIIGPVYIKSQTASEGMDSDTEASLAMVAEVTQISAVTINKLYKAVHSRNSDVFTSSELAKILDVTTRTINRLIEKLVDAGYAGVVGKNLINPKGRPARVIKLLF